MTPAVELLMRSSTLWTLSPVALNAMATPLTLKLPAPLPPSERAVAKFALASVPELRMPPRAVPLVTVPVPLLCSLARVRKLLVSVAVPRTIAEPLLREMESVAEA